MFIIFFIVGFFSIALPLFGIKKFGTESKGKKISRIFFIVVGLFLLFTAVLDAYSLITNPSEYGERLVK